MHFRSFCYVTGAQRATEQNFPCKGAHSAAAHGAEKYDSSRLCWEETAAQQLSFLNSNTERGKRAFENRDQDEENEIKKLQNLHK